MPHQLEIMLSVKESECKQAWIYGYRIWLAGHEDIWVEKGIAYQEYAQPIPQKIVKVTNFLHKKFGGEKRYKVVQKGRRDASENDIINI